MRIHKCAECAIYTLKDCCPRCGSPAYKALPPRFSPEDKYGKYRRMMKKSLEASAGG